MMLLTDCGFAAYNATEYAKWAETHNAREHMYRDMESRMAAYIIPRVPRECIPAFCDACYEQLLYEASPAAQQARDMPRGVKSFAVNGFSATMGDGTSAESLFDGGISKTARAILLNAGLLYKGVRTC